MPPTNGSTTLGLRGGRRPSDGRRLLFGAASGFCLGLGLLLRPLVPLWLTGCERRRPRASVSPTGGVLFAFGRLLLRARLVVCCRLAAGFVSASASVVSASAGFFSGSARLLLRFGRLLLGVSAVAFPWRLRRPWPYQRHFFAHGQGRCVAAIAGLALILGRPVPRSWSLRERPSAAFRLLRRLDQRHVARRHGVGDELVAEDLLAVLSTLFMSGAEVLMMNRCPSGSPSARDLAHGQVVELVFQGLADVADVLAAGGRRPGPTRRR